MKKIGFVVVFGLGLMGCSEDAKKRASVVETPPAVVTPESMQLMGTSTNTNVLALNCIIKDSPVSTKISLGLNLRQNMELITSNNTDTLVFDKQNNAVVVFNEVTTSQSQDAKLVGGNSQSQVDVKLSVDVLMDKYEITFDDQSTIVIGKMSGEGEPVFVGSEGSIECEDFKSFEDIKTMIDSDPMLDPKQSGPQ
jgi:hypothetical protein